MGATTLNQPVGAPVEGSLYVADTQSHRILGYVDIPVASNAPANFVLGHFREAAVWAERSIALRRDPMVYRILAASYGFLGRNREGLDTIRAIFDLAPKFAPGGSSLSDPSSLVDRYLEGWRRAGWSG